MEQRIQQFFSFIKKKIKKQKKFMFFETFVEEILKLTMT